MVEHLRKTSEAIILILVVLSPWAFGCVHRFFWYCLTAGICSVLLLWSIELLIEPKRRVLTRFQLPLIGLALIVVLQVMPLGPVADWVSPASAELKARLLPDQMEQLADGSTAQVPSLAARGRVSLYPAETLRRGYWLGLLMLLFTRVQDLATAASLRRLCFACLINGSILAYFSIIQHFTSETGKVFWIFQSMGASFGPFINRNHFAFYINICFGLSLGLVGSRQMSKVTRFSLHDLIELLKDSLSLWMLSVLVFMLGAVILCSSRGGMISLIGGLLITSALLAATGTFRRGWKWVLLGGAIFAVASGVQVWLGFDFVDSRYADHRDNRTELWMPLLELVRQFPLTGSGLGTLPHLEPSTRPSAAVRDVYLEYAHNEYLQVAIEMGLIGLACSCVFLWLSASKIARRIRHSRHNAWLYVGLLFSLSSVALHSFAEFGLAIPAIAFLTTVVFGHIAGVGRVNGVAKESPVGSVLVRFGAVAILIFGYFAFQDAKRNDLAWRSMLRAQRAGNEGRIDDQLSSYLQAAQHTPSDIEMIMDVAQLRFDDRQKETLADSSILSEAQQALISARELCPPSADAQFMIGRQSHTFKRADNALTYFVRSMQIRPADATLSFIAGLAFLERNDDDNALRFFRQSLSLAPTHLAEIMKTSTDRFSEDVILHDLLKDLNAATLSQIADWFEARGSGPGEDLAVATQLRRRALQRDEMQQPRSGPSFHAKGLLHAQLGEVDEALAAYESAVRFSPANVLWRLELASLLGDLGDYGNAHRHLKRVLQQRPGYSRAERLRDKLLQLEAKNGS